MTTVNHDDIVKMEKAMNGATTVYSADMQRQQREYKLIQLMLFQHRMYATATELVKVHWAALKQPELVPARIPAIDQTNNLAAIAHWMK
jgi:hypothetical protein